MLGVFIENPIVSGAVAGSQSLIGDVNTGRELNYSTAVIRATVGFVSDLILGPLADVPNSIKRDAARALGGAIIDLGAQEFLENQTSAPNEDPD